MKGREVIPPESIFQPDNFDALKFAEWVLELSYEIFENKESEQNMMDKIMDLSIKFSSFCRDEVQSKLDQLNVVEGFISDKDTSVNPDIYIEDETTLTEKSMLQEIENIDDESYIEDARNDLSGNVENTICDGCDMKIMDMSLQTTKQDDFQQADNTFVTESPLSNQNDENISKLGITVVPETDYEIGNASKKSSIDLSTVQNLKDISFDVKQDVPKKFLSDVKIKKIVDYDDSFELNLEQRSAENLDVSSLPDIATQNKPTVYNGDMDEVSVNVASTQVSAHCVDEMDKNDSNETKSAHEVHVKVTDQCNNEVIDNSQLLFYDTEDCTSSHQEISESVSVRENGDGNDEAKDNDDALKNQDCNSMTEINIEKVSDNDVCEKPKEDPSTSSVSVEIHLQKLSSKEPIQEVEDSSHDVTLSSTSGEGEGDKSIDSTFSKCFFLHIDISTFFS